MLMGIFDGINWPWLKPSTVDGVNTAQGYATFSEGMPVAVTYNGSVYEQELTRACIDRFAVTCSKLLPAYEGVPRRNIQRMVDTWPNSQMTWPKFLYRVATILETDNTAAIVPSFGKDGITIEELWPLPFVDAELVEYHGVPWVRFYTAPGEVYPIELSNTCILTRYQYESDVFGSNLTPKSTMDLIQAQESAQKAAIKNGAKIRFIGEVGSMVREDELKKKRERFVSDNLSLENDSGLLIYDNTFTKVTQVNSDSYTIDPKEMERIEENVFTYYGTNRDILQNHYDTNAWSAYYEGKIEPFAIQLSEGLSALLLTQRERKHSHIMFASNRLQYATMAEKRNMIRDMLDRGVFTINQALEVLQMPTIGEEGDVRVIRGEYINAKQIDMTERQHDHTKKEVDVEKNFYDDPNTDTEEDANAEA